MNLNVLDESATNVGDVKDMPRFPAVQRDFAFVMKEEMPVGDVMNEMKAIAGELCEEVHLFDIYRGVPIQPGEKSVALSITLRAVVAMASSHNAPMAMSSWLSRLSCSSNFMSRS